MIRLLYHGSKTGLVEDIRPSSRATCDFGRGFYSRTDGIYFDELCEKYKSGEGVPTC